jgi:Tol biopolymer transport system component
MTRLTTRRAHFILIASAAAIPATMAGSAAARCDEPDASHSTIKANDQAAASPSPLLDPRESGMLSNVRQLTSPSLGFSKAGEAYFSPDGRKVIFQAHPPGHDEYQMYVIDLDESGHALPDSLTLVSAGSGACTCGFFRPDGMRIIFGSTHLDPRLSATPRPKEDEGFKSDRGYTWGFSEWMDIFEADPDGSNRKRLTEAKGYDAECSYSPDAKLIVFTSTRTGDPEIFIMNADGTNPRQITKVAGYDGGPFFSPDGRRIVYRSDRKNDGNHQIFTNNLDGTDEIALTDNDLLNWCPFWHPSGRFMIFTEANHRRRPNYDLFLLSPDGSKRLRVTYHAAFDGLPVFSADGTRVMWTSKRGPDDSSQVFLADFAPPATLDG